MTNTEDLKQFDSVCQKMLTILFHFVRLTSCSGEKSIESYCWYQVYKNMNNGTTCSYHGPLSELPNNLKDNGTGKISYWKVVRCC